MPVWWVTGASGFLGRHVLSELAKREEEETRLIALSRHEAPLGAWPERVELLRLDLGGDDAVRQVAEQASPDYVIHCAGRTPPATEDELRRSNLVVTANLLRGLRQLNHPIRLVLAGSAAELGPVETADLPVGEEYQCKPLEPYGRIKWEVGQAALSEPSPLEPIVARVFNPIGPGLSEHQAFGRFARRLLSREPDPLTMQVGDLESRRDFIDIRDVARAMIALALKGSTRTIYHIGTGRSRRVGDGLNELIGLSGRAVRLVIDPTLGNPKGPTDSRADIQRITTETGWKPRISWEKSLGDLWQAAKLYAVRDSDAAEADKP